MGICMRSHGEELQALSRVFLYPALTCMGFGIFANIGAAEKGSEFLSELRAFSPCRDTRG